jgi:trimeric autotransporter adhesin
MTVSPSSLKFEPTSISSSTVKSYTFSAENLTGPVTITAPEGFQISLNSVVGSSNSLTLSATSGTIIPTTIYVKFSPTAAVAYSGNITHTSLGAKTENVLVSGSGAGAPEITVSTTSLPSFGEILVGSNSAPKSYTVSGKNLTGSITITAPPGFQISMSSSSGFSSSLTLPQNVDLLTLQAFTPGSAQLLPWHIQAVLPILLPALKQRIYL